MLQSWEAAFLIAVKATETGKPVYKSRAVLQGHRGKKLDMIVHSANTARQHSFRVLVANAALLGFRFWNQDVTQANLQAGE